LDADFSSGYTPPRSARLFWKPREVAASWGCKRCCCGVDPVELVADAREHLLQLGEAGEVSEKDQAPDVFLLMAWAYGVQSLTPVGG
jgi:hypothetical protein